MNKQNACRGKAHQREPVSVFKEVNGEIGTKHRAGINSVLYISVCVYTE